MFEELWKEDVETLSMGKSSSTNGEDIGSCARQLEIFLDYLSCVTVSGQMSTRYVFDENFSALLTPAEMALREALREFLAHAVPRESKSTLAFLHLARTLREMGYESAFTLPNNLES